MPMGHRSAAEHRPSRSRKPLEPSRVTRGPNSDGRLHTGRMIAKGSGSGLGRLLGLVPLCPFALTSPPSRSIGERVKSQQRGYPGSPQEGPDIRRSAPSRSAAEADVGRSLWTHRGNPGRQAPPECRKDVNRSGSALPDRSRKSPRCGRCPNISGLLLRIRGRTIALPVEADAPRSQAAGTHAARVLKAVRRSLRHLGRHRTMSGTA